MTRVVVHIPIRELLPKVRAAYEAGELQAQKLHDPTAGCTYSGPCAIGAGLTPEQRTYLDNPAIPNAIRNLMDGGWVTTDAEDHDLWRLQAIHDEWVGSTRETAPRRFLAVLEDLERTYLQPTPTPEPKDI